MLLSRVVLKKRVSVFGQSLQLDHLIAGRASSCVWERDLMRGQRNNGILPTESQLEHIDGLLFQLQWTGGNGKARTNPEWQQSQGLRSFLSYIYSYGREQHRIPQWCLSSLVEEFICKPSPSSRSTNAPFEWGRLGDHEKQFRVSAERLGNFPLLYSQHHLQCAIHRSKSFHLSINRSQKDSRGIFELFPCWNYGCARANIWHYVDQA